ncbi:hypothetical protein B0H16DRAFT_1731289 [Mycena metata]|uniref:Uncharacterized protein n=1 Tax=Mycena metata TaxID=1033252 RepID=A0AAD7I5D3_9AGAR|nr:hypothetical protein B0H16DRAFT_1731289 [Mycena metata]
MPLPTARGDAAGDAAWSKYPPDVSLAKAEVPPLSTPRLCLCLGTQRTTITIPPLPAPTTNSSSNSAHPSLPCAPPPL